MGQYLLRSPGSVVHISAERAYGLRWPTSDRDQSYQLVSPALNAQKVHAPLLIQAADNEFRASLMFFANLINYQKPVELIIYPGEGHQPHQPAHKAEIANRNVDWFDYWLNGHRDPTLEKKAQYARWDVLCKREGATQQRTRPCAYAH